MSVEIRVCRNVDGTAKDELIEHTDTAEVFYGYHLQQDNSFRVLEVRKTDTWRRSVNTLRIYSAIGYMEVSGLRLSNEMGYTDDELNRKNGSLIIPASPAHGCGSIHDS